MRFPDTDALASLVDRIHLPPFVQVRYDPPAPAVEDVAGATAGALDRLDVELESGATVALGVGSRGITDIVDVTRSAVEWCRAHDLEPKIVPAMGSHGGGTATGQRAVLAELGITEEAIGCPIDPDMGVEVIGSCRVGGRTVEVPFATAARSADAVIPLNRIAPHTSFAGPIESGICKMITVGFGKREGARIVHRFGRTYGFEPLMESMLSVITDVVPFPGGIGIVENPENVAAEIVPIPGTDPIGHERPVLERARKHVRSVPFDDVDLLVVDEIGKDVSGTGMDPNVIGRGKEDPVGGTPDIERIYVRDLTPGTQGNANGVGFADAVHSDVAAKIDFVDTYANVLTSGYPGKAALPMVMPTDELAVHALLDSVGAVPSEELGIVWIENTADISPMYASTPLVDGADNEGIKTTARGRLTFESGQLQFTRED